jgi:hypothetical protein
VFFSSRIIYKSFSCSSFETPPTTRLRIAIITKRRDKRNGALPPPGTLHDFCDLIEGDHGYCDVKEYTMLPTLGSQRYYSLQMMEFNMDEA